MLRLFFWPTFASQGTHPKVCLRVKNNFPINGQSEAKSISMSEFANFLTKRARIRYQCRKTTVLQRGPINWSQGTLT
jgi:hypothetical protein